MTKEEADKICISNKNRSHTRLKGNSESTLLMIHAIRHSELALTTCKSSKYVGNVAG